MVDLRAADVSATGLRITKVRGFDPAVGEQLELALTMSKQNYDLVAEVVWSNDDSIGCQFVARLPTVALIAARAEAKRLELTTT